MKLNLKLVLIFTVLFLFVKINYSQETYKPQKTREIQLSYNDSLVVFNILTKKRTLDANKNLFYYWYNSDKLNSNQGGFSGNLLSGKYQVFDKTKRLKNEGTFEDGLKNGVWKTWNINGSLSSLIKWKNGLKEGDAMFFDDNGSLLRIIPYRKDQINGTMEIFHGKKIEKIKYKNGEPTTSKDKTNTNKSKKKNWFKTKRKLNDNGIKEDKKTIPEDKKTKFRLFKRDKSLNTKETGKK